MGYFLTIEPKSAVPAKFCATPKTHVPGSLVKERGYRYYLPETGRWLSRDPIGEAGAYRSYATVRYIVDERIAAMIHALPRGDRRQSGARHGYNEGRKSILLRWSSVTGRDLTKQVLETMLKLSNNSPYRNSIFSGGAFNFGDDLGCNYRFSDNNPSMYMDVLGLLVVNDGSCRIIVKPEHGGFGNPTEPPVVLDPGETYPFEQDGIMSCCPAGDCRIFKTTGGVDIHIMPTEQYFLGGDWPHLMIQACRGGCKDFGFTSDSEWGTKEQVQTLCGDAYEEP